MMVSFKWIRLTQAAQGIELYKHLLRTYVLDDGELLFHYYWLKILQKREVIALLRFPYGNHGGNALV